MMPTTASIRRLALVALSAALLPLLMIVDGEATTEFDLVRVVGARGFEMQVNQAPDGTIFVDEPAGLGAHSDLFRYDPSKGTFKELTFPTPYGRYPGGGDSDVVTAPGGRVYFLDLWLGSNSVAASDDNGDTWVRGNPFTTLPLSDRQWLALGPRDPQTGLDTIYAFYNMVQPPRLMMMAKSTDGGMTWIEHYPTTSTVMNNPFGKPVSDPDSGLLAFPFVRSNVAHVARSENGGMSWDAVEVSVTNDVKSDVYGLALDALNPSDMYTVWVDNRFYGVKLSYSRDAGKTWKGFPPVNISDTAGSTVFPWVAARGGKVGVAWYETSDTNKGPDAAPSSSKWRLMYRESLDRGVTWSAPVVVDDHIKDGFICTAGLSCSGGREPGDFVQLTIGNDGKAMIAYYDRGIGHVAFQK